MLQGGLHASGQLFYMGQLYCCYTVKTNKQQNNKTEKKVNHVGPDLCRDNLLATVQQNLG